MIIGQFIKGELFSSETASHSAIKEAIAPATGLRVTSANRTSSGVSGFLLQRSSLLPLVGIYLLGSFDFTLVAINPVNPPIVEPRSFYLGSRIAHFEIPDLQLKAALKLPPKVFW
jgi:hypothetical protein